MDHSDKVSDLELARLRDMWIQIRILAEGSDWKRNTGETLIEWAVRKIQQKNK